jgi:DNA-binding NarL/FixJ family response regulator
MARKRGRPPHDDRLTPAEWRVVNAVRHGLSDAAIAKRRGISRDAVRYHVRNALVKLGLANRQELHH